MYYPIYETSVTKRTMPYSKASHGGDKLTIKLTTWHDGSWRNRTEMRFVFHHDKVYVTKVHYNKRWANGRWVKSDYSAPIKSQHDFNMYVLGYDYRGEALEPLALVDLVLKMHTDMHLCAKRESEMYLAY